MKRIAEALRLARQAGGYQQRQIADLLGISYGHMNDIELGRRALQEHHIGKLPTAIREPVSRAFIAEHHEAIRRINEAAE